MIDPQVFPFVTAKLHRLGDSAFGAGFTYPNQVTYTNRPFLERGADGKQKNGAGWLRFLVKFKLFWF